MYTNGTEQLNQRNLQNRLNISFPANSPPEGWTVYIPPPPPEPTPEEVYAAKVKAIEAAIDTLVDDTALARGYKTKTAPPATACLAYAGFANPYQTEAIAFGQWKASIWPIVFQIQADYDAGLRPEPTIDEVLAELPEMVWP